MPDSSTKYELLTVKELKKRIKQAEYALTMSKKDNPSKNLQLMRKVLQKKLRQSSQVKHPHTQSKTWVTQITHIITDDDLDGISAGAIFLHESPEAKVFFTNARRLTLTLEQILQFDSHLSPMIVILDIGTEGQDDLNETLVRCLKNCSIIYIDHHLGSEMLSFNVPNFHNYSNPRIGATAILASNITENSETTRLSLLGAVSDRAIGFDAIPTILREEVVILQRALCSHVSNGKFPSSLIHLLANSPNEWQSKKPYIKEYARLAEEYLDTAYKRVVSEMELIEPNSSCSVYNVSDNLSKVIDGLAGTIASRVAIETKKIAIIIYRSQKHGIKGTNVKSFSSRSHRYYNVDLLQTLKPVIEQCDGKIGGHAQALGGWLPVNKIGDFLANLQNLELIFAVSAPKNRCKG